MRADWKLPRDRRHPTLLLGVVGALNRQLARPAARQWLIALGGAGGIGILYFFAALVGLALRSQPSDVAVFWPASGVAVGTLIVFGKRAVPAAVIGVVVGTVAANLMNDRSIWTALFKGFCNAGEALMVAWLLLRWFGWPFTFGDLRRALGFVVAACLGAVVSALGGAAIITLLHTPAPYWEVWRAWFLSDGVGIVVVAPLVIEGGQLWRELPSRARSFEGVGVLALVAFISLRAIDHPTGSWLTFDPDAIVLPLLLWLIARCHRVFGIAGAFVESIAVIYAVTFGIGHFGDNNVPIMERVSGAQMTITMVTLYTLVLAALFSERERNEVALRHSNNRLRSALNAEEEGNARLAEALSAGQVMAFAWDAATGLSKRSENAADILGSEQDRVASSRGSDFLKHIHPDDRASLKTRISELRAGDPLYAQSFRYVREDGRQVWLEEIAKGEFDAAENLLRIRGLTRDITDRKRAEERQHVLVAELDHRVKNVLATVSAVIAHTRQGSGSVAKFVAALEGRIRSMATAHELLSSGRWQGLSLTELARRELAPYATRNNTKINGPEVVVNPEAGQAMAMVLHELATNAAKYGALSTDSGRVEIRWDRRPNGHAPSHLVLEWREIGGPPVPAPGKSNYGTTTIRDLIPYEFGGAVDLVLAPDGVRCRLELPADWLRDDGKPIAPSAHISLRAEDT